MKSTHIPEFAGDITEVPAAGSVVVDSGLREVQAATCSLAQDSVATAAAASIEVGSPRAGSTVLLTIKTWAADGATAGSTAANVGWMALGK